MKQLLRELFHKLTFDLEADELEIFLEEANEHLQGMEAGILHLEQAADEDTLNAVFRAAHTLKALAGTIGHRPMAELTHSMETLFDAFRSAKFSPSRAVIDDLLAAMDVLKVLRDEIVTLEPSNVEMTTILARLNAALSVQGRQAPPQDRQKLIRPSLTPDQIAQLNRFAGQPLLGSS